MPGDAFTFLRFGNPRTVFHSWSVHGIAMIPVVFRFFDEEVIMPGAIRTCFLCGRSNRSSFSSYMKIDCLEQERRIQEGYRQRYKINLDDSLIDKQVHRLCYRSIIQRQPPARFRSVSHPYKYARCSRHRLSQTQSHSVTLIDNSVQCLNEHEQIDNASHRSLDITNNKEVLWRKGNLEETSPLTSRIVWHETTTISVKRQRIKFWPVIGQFLAPQSHFMTWPIVRRWLVIEWMNFQIFLSTLIILFHRQVPIFDK